MSPFNELVAIRKKIKRTRWGHWLWTGELTEKGYARVRYQGKYVRVHRLAWELDGRELLPNHDLHHVCPASLAQAGRAVAAAVSRP